MKYNIIVDQEDNDEILEYNGGDNNKIKEPVTINVRVEIEKSRYEKITNLQEKILKVFK